MRNAVLIFITVSLLGSARLSGADPLTLRDCFRAALKRSEVLAGQRELVVQAQEHYSQAWGSILPSVNAFYSYLQQDSSGLAGTGSAASQPTMKITADQPLFRGFREFAALDEAKALITA